MRNSFALDGWAPIGVLTSTGYRDDQYVVKLRVDTESRPVIQCRFIDQPANHDQVKDAAAASQHH
jgi:hypothetical protein